MGPVEGSCLGARPRMGIFDRFSKKDKGPEVSEGGSHIHRYSEEEWEKTPIGFAETWAETSKAREKVYLRRFGVAKQVWHEAIPLVPHIDVMEYYRSSETGSVCTLVTSGMSDMAMKVPPKTEAPARVELIFYCTEPQPVYISTLRFLQRIAHDRRRGSGHSIPFRLAMNRRELWGARRWIRSFCSRRS